MVTAATKFINKIPKNILDQPAFLFFRENEARMHCIELVAGPPASFIEKSFSFIETHSTSLSSTTWSKPLSNPSASTPVSTVVKGVKGRAAQKAAMASAAAAEAKEIADAFRTAGKNCEGDWQLVARCLGMRDAEIEFCEAAATKHHNFTKSFDTDANEVASGQHQLMKQQRAWAYCFRTWLLGVHSFETLLLALRDAQRIDVLYLLIGHVSPQCFSGPVGDGPRWQWPSCF